MNTCIFKSTLFCLLVGFPLSLILIGCDEDSPSACSIHSQCGIGFLCRSSECVPKCNTYLTCEEGEACVMDDEGRGACEVPPADYCSVIAPQNAPADMGDGVYMPCRPESDAGVGGMMETNTGGASTGGASTGGVSTGGANTGGASTGGASTGGASTGGASTGGEMNGGSSGGVTLELVGGTPQP